MPLIEDSVIERVRAATDLVALIGGTVKLKRSGALWKGLCPFHQEKSPSLTVTPARNCWHCFGCGMGGDCIAFVKEFQGVDFLTALKQLADAAHIPVEADSRPGLPAGRFKRLMPAPGRPDAKNTTYSPESTRIEAISPEFGRWLHAKGITRRTALDLASHGRIGLQSSQIVFFYEQGVKVRRTMQDSHSCYWAAGFAESPWLVQECDNPAIRRVCICEGESDTMRLRALVQPDTAVIGMPGASWRPSPVMCWRIGAFREVILCFDGDAAGAQAEERIGPLLAEHAQGVRLGRMVMEAGKDVCTTARDVLQNFLQNPVKIS